MALPTGVYKRGAVFHIQIKVPADLRTAFTSPFFVRKSLATEDRAAATAQGHRLWADATEAFALARKKLEPARATKLTPALLHTLHERIRYEALKADDAMRYDPETLARVWPMLQARLPSFGPLSTDRRERFEQLQDAQYVWSKALALSAARGSTNAGHIAADIQADLLGIVVDWTDEKDALIALTRTTVQAYADAARRSDGDPVPTPEAPALPEDLLEPPKSPKKPKDAALHLRDVVPHWLGAKTRKQDAKDKTERALKLLEQSGQDYPLTSLTRPHGAALRAFLVHPDRGFKGKTALNNWASLQALMNVAEDVGLIEQNRWRGMTLEVTDSATRKEHTGEELQQLFHTPLFLTGTYPVVQKVEPADAYWCMLLGLWTGARVGEIAQLEVVDIQVHNGLAVLSIHGRAGTVKTEQSERVLPVPPDLLRLGFPEWVQRRRDAGAVKLFPSLHRLGAVTPGEIMSEWNREFRKTVGAPSGALNGYHRFRHTVRSGLAALHVGKETADALTGHGATGSSGTKVYTHIGVGTIYEALGRLRFPLDLPRVFAPSP